MSTTQSSARGQWSSKSGFVLAAAGSAIGLGNIWRFPYVTGQSGGAAFVVLYLVCVLIICLPYLFAELALGRSNQKNPVGAIQAIRSRTPWTLVGALCVVTGVFILSYYAVIAGWAFGYIFKNLLNPGGQFGRYIASAEIVIPLFAVFMALTMTVVYGGVEKGIERWSKVLMPVLLLLMVVVIVRAVTLPGAGEGLRFYLKPDFTKVDGSVVLAALGQAFFSLSLGMGAMITYGSYLSKQENLAAAGSYVAIADTSIAILAGFMIFPALFAVGASPNEGPTLIFVVLPQVFQVIPFGTALSVLFFILLSIAALTSTVSLLEVVVAYFVDEKRWSRAKSVLTIGIVTFLFGVPSALSAGASPFFSDLSPILGENGFFGRKDFLSIMDFIWGNLALGVGALLISIFVGWIWGSTNAGKEMETGSNVGHTFTRIWSLFLRYICPAVIFIVLLNLFGVFG